MSASCREIRLIDWVDSAHRSGWHDPDEDPLTAAGCRSVGFVLRETDQEVVLCQSVDEPDGGIDAEMAIPKAAITKSVTLRKAKE